LRIAVKEVCRLEWPLQRADDDSGSSVFASAGTDDLY
jgi:hypothetical protein